MDCIFCKIANKEIPAETIYEDAHALAVMDVHPLSPGHVMILSKVHAETLLDLPDGEVGSVFLAVKKTAAMIEASLKPDGFTIGINHGRSAGQAVPHLHIHVIPRYKDDGGTSIHGVVKNPPKESIGEIKSKILKHGH